MRASVVDGEAVRHEQLQAVIDELNAATSTFLAKSGGIMTGDLDMGGNRIKNLPETTEGDDAINRDEVLSIIGSFGGLPVGTMVGFGGATAPTGWLLCDGAAVSRTTYLNLFNTIGVGFGVGNGVTTFNVPDSRGRTEIGAGLGTGLTSRALGVSLGAETHTLTINETPEHHHSINGSTNDTGDPGDNALTDPADQWGNFDTDDTGGDQPHNNMQPSLVVTKIIKF
jgi:microcystin-dependent protein